MRALTVFWLHEKDGSRDEKILPVVEYGLSSAFREFCRDTFDVREMLEYPPLKLIPISSPEQLPAALFIEGDVRKGLTEVGSECVLFLIDDVFMDSLIGKLPIKSYFKAILPAIPKVVLTRPGHNAIALPQRRWTKKLAYVFEHPTKYHERLVHLFKSFWMPRFWSSLKQYVRVREGTTWHTPGHANGRAFASSPFLKGFHEAFGSMIFRADLSVSVESLGDLSSPEAHTPLSEAQRLSSEIFGTAHSCYVTNGTSTSNKAMLMTLLKPGETVLVDRNCHKSVHHAIVMSGAVPRYLPARWNQTLGVWGPVSLKDIERELAVKNPPRLLILTTCTYEGVLYPVWEVSRLCEKMGVIFYADEAWAAYLNFHPRYTYFNEHRGEVMRYNAVNESSGAHFAVQSTHKTMAAFSQASMIHVSTRFKALLEDDTSPQYRWLRKRFALHGHGSYEKFTHDLREFLRYWHSTSPHYPFLATLDISGVQMRLEGLKLLDERLKWTAAFRKRVAKASGKTEDECFASLSEIAGGGNEWAKQGYMKDPLKILMTFRSPQACRTFKKSLLKSRIQWEKSSATTILFLVTSGTTEEHFEELFRICYLNRALIGRPHSTSSATLVNESVSGQPVVLPHAAALCDGCLVPLTEAVGRIASQFLVPYPPGIPVFIPGLKITKGMVKLIENVIDSEGPSAVHGLFCRGAHAPYYVEVLDRDEEKRLL